MNDTTELDELFNNNNLIERSLSYSRLSDYDRNGPVALINRSTVTGYGVTIGSIVDDLTLPIPEYEFDENYIICDFDKPTATLGKLVDIILDNYVEVPSIDTILNICKINNFWKRSKDETIIDNFNVDEFWNYLNVHIEGSVKNIITSSDYNKSKTISEAILNHNNSKHIFENNLECINRFKLNFEYNGVKLKGEVDRLLINHEDKTIQLLDLKTGQDNALSFINSFLKYRYYLQEAVYTQSEDYIKNTLNLQDYKMLPFQFLYIGRNELLPVIYTVSDKWHDAAKNGFHIKHHLYKGLDTLIEDVKWHFYNNNFEAPREIYDTNGMLNLDDNFINVI